MPKINTRPSERLQVRTHVWHQEGQPGVEVHHQGKWRAVRDLAAARDFAAAEGYAGIHVTPV